MADFNNILGGLNIPSQIPLNIKEYVESEQLLKNTADLTQRVFTYHKGLKVHCLLEKTNYEWQEVPVGSENTGLLLQDYIYPSSVVIFGIDYSNKKYNFFKILKTKKLKSTNGSVTITENANDIDFSVVTGTIPDGSETKVTAGTNVTVTGIGTTTNPYVINSISNNLQKEIKIDHILSSIDNNYTIFVNNQFTTNDLTITVPTGLPNNFICRFVQSNVNDVLFVKGLGVSDIFNPTGLKIKGFGYDVLLVKKENTETFYLLRDTKSNIVCKIPILNNVTYTPNNFVSFDFDTNGFNYGVFTPSLEYSIDNGVNWSVCTSITQITVGLWGGTISSVVSGTPIKYRVVLSGNGCNNQISNIVDGGNWQGGVYAGGNNAQISWQNTGTFEDRNGSAGIQNVEIFIDGVSNGNTPYEWETNINNAGFTNYGQALANGETFDSVVGLNEFRLKVTDNGNNVFYSNILKYTGI